MNWRKLGNISLFLILICMLGSANAIVCITMSNGSEWKDAKLKLNEPAYFSFRVYNSSADGRVCDSSSYEIEITLVNEEGEYLEEVFDWEIDSPYFDMVDGQNKRVLLTLIPKKLGYYTVNVMTKLVPKNAEGTKLVYATSAKINASISLEGDESYNQYPFWKVRKDCPNGLVVKEGEECPRLCEDGTKVFESLGEKCPEDEVDFWTSIGLAGRGEIILWGGIGGVIATIAILGAVAYKRKQEAPATTEDEYYADQGY